MKISEIEKIAFATIATLLLVGVALADTTSAPARLGTAPDSSQTPSDTALTGISWGNITASASINKDSLPQNDTLIFTVKITLHGNPGEFKIDDPETPKVSNLNIVSTSSSNRVETRNGTPQYLRIYSYLYSPKTVGMAYISPITIRYTHTPSSQARELRTGRLSVKVVEPVRAPRPLPLWIYIAIGGIVVSAAAILFIFLRKKERGENAEAGESEPLETIFEQRLKKLIANSRDYKEICERLPVLIREYCAERFGISARGMSTTELVDALSSLGIEGAIANELQSSLLYCDEVRFAGSVPDDGKVQIASAVFEKLIRSLKPEQTNDKENNDR